MKTVSRTANIVVRSYQRLSWLVFGLGVAAPVYAQAPTGTPECAQCRDAQCRNYQGAGIDLVKGCFDVIDPSFGASASDPSFLQDCIDLVGCAQTTECAYGPTGLAQCYCGSASPDVCINAGPAADAQCLPQVQEAARSTVNADIALRFTDLQYPVGWAYFLLECDSTLCTSACTPNECGDGILAGPLESCDDGNTTSNDGCSSTCKTESCGDGVKQASEACDDGNRDDRDGCTASCMVGPVCGDRRVENSEQCDDGNRTSNDGCSSSCQRESCGDGIRQTNEECDDGNKSSNDACNNRCRRTGLVLPCDECRDQNCRDYQGSGIDMVAGCFEAVNTDLGAQPDPDFLQDCIDVVVCAHTNNCSTSSQSVSACYCGAATPDQCISAGPGANAKCVTQIQEASRSTVNSEIALRFTDLTYPLGWAHFVVECEHNYCSASCFTPVCGNGVVEGPSEACDDGNTRNNDGCSAKCKRETRRRN